MQDLLTRVVTPSLAIAGAHQRQLLWAHPTRLSTKAGRRPSSGTHETGHRTVYIPEPPPPRSPRRRARCTPHAEYAAPDARRRRQSSQGGAHVLLVHTSAAPPAQRTPARERTDGTKPVGTPSRLRRRACRRLRIVAWGTKSASFAVMPTLTSSPAARHASTNVLWAATICCHAVSLTTCACSWEPAAGTSQQVHGCCAPAAALPERTARGR